MLPVGISFFTFQAAGYLIDVFKKKITPADSFLDFLLFISFFPQLVAGPIERASHLLPQLKNLEAKFEYTAFSSGLKLIAWGFFKKIVIADRISKLIDPVYSQPGDFNSISLFIATILFGYQIYCDFSGYSDIAKGLAQLFGIELMLNFRQPYLSKSIIEFWKKWHISLTTWFKDYLFIPLGGNRVGTIQFIINVLIVFLISGIWHGANWTFVIWGLVHFVFYIAAKYIDISFLKLPNFIKVISTFIIANLAWFFFRSDSVEISFTILNRIINDFDSFSIGFDSNSLITILILVSILEIFSLKSNQYGYPVILDSKIFLLRWSLYFAIIIATIVLGEFNESSFIYFKF
jgi:alginate O-acetyltransferase complex protein AlgI